jgi:hypothetical protein
MSTFVILLCSEDNQYAYVESGRETLLPGVTWSFSGAGGQLICGTVVEQSTLGVPNYTAATEYEGCGDCLTETTISVTANTIEDICVILCVDPVTGGSVATEADTPHPVWSGMYGEQITQGNAVVLGGPNGLNS